MSLVLLIARLLLGLGIAAHGAQKLFGWFGGGGLTGTAGYFEKLGFRPSKLFAFAAGVGEISGILVALGFLGPTGPALMILVMTVATLTVHVPNGFFNTANGFELPMVYATGAFLLAFTGPGIYSLDYLLGLQWLTTPRNAWVAIVLAILLAIVNVSTRRRAPPAGATGT